MAIRPPAIVATRAPFCHRQRLRFVTDLTRELSCCASLPRKLVIASTRDSFRLPGAGERCTRPPLRSLAILGMLPVVYDAAPRPARRDRSRPARPASAHRAGPAIRLQPPGQAGAPASVRPPDVAGATARSRDEGADIGIRSSLSWGQRSVILAYGTAVGFPLPSTDRSSPALSPRPSPGARCVEGELTHQERPVARLSAAFPPRVPSRRTPAYALPRGAKEPAHGRHATRFDATLVSPDREPTPRHTTRRPRYPIPPGRPSPPRSSADRSTQARTPISPPTPDLRPQAGRMF
jgi:hypothetical protein